MRREALFGIATLALLAAPSASHAAGAAGAYLWKGSEVAGADTGGIGAKGWFDITDLVFVSGRVQAGDVVDLDYTEARAGAGIGKDLGKGAAVYAGAEAIRADVEFADDEIGVGIFAGTTFSPAEGLRLSADFGIVDLGDYGEASEFGFGASYELTPRVSIAVERSEELIIGAVTQVGARFSF